MSLPPKYAASSAIGSYCFLMVGTKSNDCSLYYLGVFELSLANREVSPMPGSGISFSNFMDFGNSTIHLCRIPPFKLFFLKKNHFKINLQSTNFYKTMMYFLFSCSFLQTTKVIGMYHHTQPVHFKRFVCLFVLKWCLLLSMLASNSLCSPSWRWTPGLPASAVTTTGIIGMQHHAIHFKGLRVSRVLSRWLLSGLKVAQESLLATFWLWIIRESY